MTGLWFQLSNSTVKAGVSHHRLNPTLSYLYFEVRASRQKISVGTVKTPAVPFPPSRSCQFFRCEQVIPIRLGIVSLKTVIPRYVTKTCQSATAHQSLVNWGNGLKAKRCIRFQLITFGPYLRDGSRTMPSIERKPQLIALFSSLSLRDKLFVCCYYTNCPK